MDKKINTDTLVNWWLGKYFNTNLDKVLEENSKWNENPFKYSREFYEMYQVTQEQHDEWLIWAKKYVKTTLKISTQRLNLGWGFLYLNSAPMIKIT